MGLRSQLLRKNPLLLSLVFGVVYWSLVNRENLGKAGQAANLIRHVVLKERNRMSGFVLSRDDVVSMDVERSFTESKTSKVKDIMNAILDLLNTSDLPVDDWINGVEGEVLQALKGGGWQKGKIRMRVRLEFIPENPPTPKPSEGFTDSDSRLDEFSSDLDI